ncbi:MAG: protein-glutamate O-methyltransferase [Deltaproteobacteria bacterium]|nr:protein-glutamate O-methyltransferase [Deltaproteobacteria bacterium]
MADSHLTDIKRPVVFQPPDLTDAEYQTIANFVHKTSGINLLDGKKELVRARLTKRIAQLEMKNFKTYFQYVMTDSSGDELVFLLDALATNLTSFWREPQHFIFMAKTFLPELEMSRKRGKTGGPRLRIWSAACSSGEEPYTIAMVVFENSHYFSAGGDFRMLATDLSTKVLNVAKKGQYGPESAKNIPPAVLAKYLTKNQAEKGGYIYTISPEIRRLISFRRFNLMDPMPYKGPMDLIFCRNVMIYFDRDTIAKLVDKFYKLLEPGGYLFIGHSESLSGLQHKFTYVAPCIYRKLQR